MPRPAAPLRPSPSGLTVLSLLRVGPLHPYGMQRLIKAWGKDQVVNVGARANLYKTINRLHEAGLIAVRQTERDQQYPERTVYELTDEGRETGVRWLEQMLGARRNEFPEFPAALSFAMLLPPAELGVVLGARLATVNESVTALRAELEQYPDLPRITLLETEFLLATTEAEAGWLEGVVADLEAGRLAWTEEMLAAVAAG